MNKHPGRYLEVYGIRKNIWCGKVSENILIEVLVAQIQTYLVFHRKLFGGGGKLRFLDFWGQHFDIQGLIL